MEEEDDEVDEVKIDEDDCGTCTNDNQGRSLPFINTIITCSNDHQGRYLPLISTIIGCL